MVTDGLKVADRAGWNVERHDEALDDTEVARCHEQKITQDRLNMDRPEDILAQIVKRFEVVGASIQFGLNDFRALRGFLRSCHFLLETLCFYSD